MYLHSSFQPRIASGSIYIAYNRLYIHMHMPAWHATERKKKRNRGRGGRSDNTNEIGWYIAVIFTKLKYISWVDMSLNILQPILSTRNRFFLSFFLSFFFRSPLFFFSEQWNFEEVVQRESALISNYRDAPLSLAGEFSTLNTCLRAWYAMNRSCFSFFFLFISLFFSSTVQLCRIITKLL